MTPDVRDRGYLEDLLTAAEEVSIVVTEAGGAYTRGDLIARRALEKCLLNLGEAAGHLSQSFKDKYPQVPWRAVVGLRNVLAHEYGAVDYQALWQVATRDVPELVKSLTGG